MALTLEARARRLMVRADDTRGQENIVTDLDVQRNDNEVVRQYQDALLRHRRGLLRLNAAVARRALP